MKITALKKSAKSKIIHSGFNVKIAKGDMIYVVVHPRDVKQGLIKGKEYSSLKAALKDGWLKV